MRFPKIVRDRILRAANSAADAERSKKDATPESIRLAYKRAHAREWTRAAYALRTDFRLRSLAASRKWRQKAA